MKDETEGDVVIHGHVEDSCSWCSSVKKKKKKTLGERFFSISWRLKQGIDCDSVLPEGCVSSA